jgi:hypothetical protein
MLPISTSALRAAVNSRNPDDEILSLASMEFKRSSAESADAFLSNPGQRRGQREDVLPPH